MTQITPEALELAAQALTEARATTLGVEVTTPVVYPNGDLVTSVVVQEGDRFTIHDAGLAAMQLATEGAVLGRDATQRFRAVCIRYDCDFDGGRVLRICGLDDIATSVMLVANASRAVADYTFDVRRHAESGFRAVVTEKLRQIVGNRLRENEAFKGKSGRLYRVAGVVLDASQQRPVAFVGVLPSRAAVANHFREFFDLHAQHPGVLKESIYDDASDFRPDEDGWVLKQVGDLIPYSRLSDRLPRVVKAAVDAS